MDWTLYFFSLLFMLVGFLLGRNVNRAEKAEIEYWKEYGDAILRRLNEYEEFFSALKEISNRIQKQDEQPKDRRPDGQ